MDKKMFTIMTPTYNRANLLERLYKSILNQNTLNLEWIIVDDGSTDNTKQVVESFITENKIKIKYIYQENKGKYYAYNTGIENASGDLFFCVDSDDILADKSLKTISEKYFEAKDINNIAGFVSLKADLNGILLSDYLPEDRIEHFYDLKRKYNIKGEFCIIYFLSILRNFKFPNVSPEKFVGECVLYDKIDMQYKMFTINKVMNICEYQPDGLTNAIRTNMLKNPTGYKIYYMQRIDIPCTFKERIGYIIRYNTFKRLSPNRNYFYNGRYKILVKLLSFTGVVGRIYYLREKNN